MKKFLNRIRIVQVFQKKIYDRDVVVSRNNEHYTVVEIKEGDASHIKNKKGYSITVDLNRSHFIKCRIRSFWGVFVDLYHKIINSYELKRMMTNGNKK